MTKDVLIVAYNKPDQFDALLRVLERNLCRIFVHLDISETFNPENSKLLRYCTELVSHGRISLKISNSNLGSCYGPISAFDWFFSIVETGYVFEEDVIPSDALFEENLELIPGFIYCFYVPIAIPRYSQPVWRSTKLFHSWGWAAEASTYSLIRDSIVLEGRYPVSDALPRIVKNYFSYLSIISSKKLRPTWWDFQFISTCVNLGVVIRKPTQSFVQYEGYGNSASHTQAGDPLLRFRHVVFYFFVYIFGKRVDVNFYADVLIWLKFGFVKALVFSFSDLSWVKWRK